MKPSRVTKGLLAIAGLTLAWLLIAPPGASYAADLLSFGTWTWSETIGGGNAAPDTFSVTAASVPFASGYKASGFLGTYNHATSYTGSVASLGYPQSVSSGSGSLVMVTWIDYDLRWTCSASGAAPRINALNATFVSGSTFAYGEPDSVAAWPGTQYCGQVTAPWPGATTASGGEWKAGGTPRYRAARVVRITQGASEYAVDVRDVGYIWNGGKWSSSSLETSTTAALGSLTMGCKPPTFYTRPLTGPNTLASASYTVTYGGTVSGGQGYATGADAAALWEAATLGNMETWASQGAPVDAPTGVEVPWWLQNTQEWLLDQAQRLAGLFGNLLWPLEAILSW